MAETGNRRDVTGTCLGERVLLAEGREAEVFLLADGKVLKLMRKPASGPQARREAAALRALAENGHRTPRVFESVVVDGRPGLVMEHVAGTDFLTMLGRRPTSALKFGRLMAEAHLEMHRCAAPEDLPDLHEEMRQRLGVATALDRGLRDAALRILEGLPRGDRLCHGDLHFGNMLWSGSGAVVIDWGDASRGDPTGDVARSSLLLRLGEPPPGAPKLLRYVAPSVRRALVARYLETYRRQSPIDSETLERWMIVRAATRTVEGIPSELPKLASFLRQHLPAYA